MQETQNVRTRSVQPDSLTQTSRDGTDGKNSQGLL